MIGIDCAFVFKLILLCLRDTTVQTLTVQPSVQNGIITYEDSPLVSLSLSLFSYHLSLSCLHNMDAFINFVNNR